MWILHKSIKYQIYNSTSLLVPSPSLSLHSSGGWSFWIIGMLYIFPCYSKLRSRDQEHQPLTWTLLKMQTLRPHPNLLNQNLQFNKIPRWYVYTFKFEDKLFVEWGGRKVYFLSLHPGRPGFWIPKCYCRRLTGSWLYSIISVLGKGLPANQAV